ncbi:MAG: ATP-binding protein [Defluviitaleaceae bacterium]|nr:ATP-binding protein [Defluviitaleaceae bacterium]
MKMRRTKGIVCALSLCFLFLTALSACSVNNGVHHGPRVSESPFATFSDVPGIEPEEIAAIEELQERYASFEYGMILTTEAFIGLDGKVSGYSALLCEWLTDFFGITFIPVVLPPMELFARLNSGALGFSGNLTPTEERMRMYHMTDPIAERQYVTVRLKDSPPVEEILSERPLRYIFIENTPMIDFVTAAAEPGSFEPFFALNDIEARGMLLNGIADAYITTSVAGVFFIEHEDIIVEDFFPLLFNTVAMATANHDLEPIISVIRKAQRNGVMPYLNYLYQKGSDEFRRHAIQTLLTEEERAFIRYNPSVPIAAFNASYPLSFWNARESEWQGVFFDVMNEVSALTGLHFRIVHDEHPDRAAANQMLARGDVKLIPGVIWSRELEDRFLWSEHLLLDDRYALISKAHFPQITVNEIIHVSVGVARDSPHEQMFNRWFPNHRNVVTFDGINDALDALTLGQVDVVMSEQRRVLQLTHLQEQPDYKVNMVFNEPLDMHITFARDAEILRSIVDKALRVVDIEGTVLSWTQRTYDFRARMLEARLPWLIGAIILALLVLILSMVFVARNRNMARSINRQKESIEDALVKLHLAMHAGKIYMWDMEIDINNPLEPGNHANWDDLRQLIGYENEADFPNTAGSLIMAMHPEDGQRVNNAFISHIMDTSGKTPYNTEYRMFKKNGELITVHATCETVRDEHGNPLRVAGTVIDVSETKAMINDLEAAKAQSEMANRAKSEFLSHISHEIRTPMNAVLGTAEIQLQKETHTPEVEEAFNTIYGSGNLLLNIINDILDLSKIEAGKLEIIPRQYDIPSLIYDTMQLNLLRYDSKPIDFDLKIDKRTPLDMFGDELRIKQVLNNVISNAFKYTDSGKIELSVRVEIEGKPINRPSEAHTPCTLVIQVADTGHGMTEDQINKLFEEYTRFNLDTNRTIVGTGLGMHITKRLVDAMKGEIIVKSEYGVGSTFIVKIPQMFVGSAVCGPDMAERLCGSRFGSTFKPRQSQIIYEYMPYGSVLVVDDVESNLYVAKGMMLPYGLKIETAGSGFEAVEKVRNGNTYDIIFMDHMMPKMNGLETTQKLRGMGYANPIVALTANAVMGSSEVFLSNGFDAYISKPIDIRELNNALNRLVRDKQPPEVIETVRLEASRRKQTLRGPSQSAAFNEKIISASLRDIGSAAVVLKNILTTLSATNEADIDLYTTTVHGMKSALSNIGEKQLSETAYGLEQIGKINDTNLILTETPSFIASLEALARKIKPDEAASDEDISDGDLTLLREKLLEIKAACERIRKKAAKAALDELLEKAWPGKVRNLLDDISDYLLSGEYKKAAVDIGNYLAPTD